MTDAEKIVRAYIQLIDAENKLKGRIVPDGDNLDLEIAIACVGYMREALTPEEFRKEND